MTPECGMTPERGITPERWQKICELFHDAAELAPAEADAFIRRACGSDLELYAEVRGMLDEHYRTGPMDKSPWPVGEEPLFAPGQVVSGRYRILRFVSRGGMGEVYEADDLELGERNALKTLLPGIAGDQRMIDRFKQEIQLARKIAHPNVCRVFDLARHPPDTATADTTYFLTMEFLPGETLAERLQRAGPLAVPVALALLQQMAAALDAAHGSGIIHRDFKPSNVMLVETPAGTRAVVTDFGLARSFTGEATASSPSSRLMGTVEYMAPELFSGRPASVASDVYALGVVAGKMAHPQPGSHPAWDRAVSRALEQRPENRFPSAGSFVRALGGETASVTLHLPAFTRRRAVTAGLTVFAGAGGLIAWWRWQVIHTRPSREALAFYQKGVEYIQSGAYFAATKALEQATRNATGFSLAHARLAEAWVELQVPEKAGREMLLARREIPTRLADLDRLQIEAIDLTITREFPAAIARYEQMQRLAPGRFDLDLGRAYEKANRPADAIQSFRRAADGPSHSAAAQLRLAILYSRTADPAKAAALFREAEQTYRMDNNLEGSIAVALEKGIDANRRGRFAEGKAELQKALETARLAGNLQQEISAMLQLATLAYSTNDAAEAEHLARTAMSLAHANQMEALAISGAVNLGNAYLRKRDFAKAEAQYQEALAMAHRNGSHRGAALSLLSLASLHDQQKRSEEAAREAREALEFYRTTGYAYESSLCLTLLGRYYRNAGRFAESLEAFRASLQMAEKGHDEKGIALAHSSIGSLLEAQELYPAALEHYQNRLQSNPSATVESKGYAALQCGDVLWQLGKYSEALATFEQAAAAAAELPVIACKLAGSRAEMALSQCKPAEAAGEARHALAQQSGTDPLTAARLQRTLGLALLRQGKAVEGRRLCEESLSAVSRFDNLGALLNARLAVLEARLKTADRAAALTVFDEIRPALANHPESRWRALAMLAGAGAAGPADARQALEELARLWGDGPYRIYLTRPDVHELSWPLLQFKSAVH